MITPKAKRLLLRMMAGRLIILLVFNLILVFLIILDIRLDAKIAIGALIGCLNVGFIFYLISRHKRVLWASGLASQTANVKLRAHAMTFLDSPNNYQTAFIQFTGNEATGKSQLKVEIGMSSVALPNMTDTFPAKIFMDNGTPVLILNEDLGMMATISGVLEKTEA